MSKSVKGCGVNYNGLKISACKIQVTFVHWCTRKAQHSFSIIPQTSNTIKHIHLTLPMSLNLMFRTAKSSSMLLSEKWMNERRESKICHREALKQIAIEQQTTKFQSVRELCLKVKGQDPHLCRIIYHSVSTNSGFQRTILFLSPNSLVDNCFKR